MEKENTMTPEQAIERIEATIAEKTEGMISKEEMISIKSEIASVKEIAEKKEDTTEMKTAIARIEGKMEGLKERKMDEPKAKSTPVEQLDCQIWSKDLQEFKEENHLCVSWLILPEQHQSM